MNKKQILCCNVLIAQEIFPANSIEQTKGLQTKRLRLVFVLQDHENIYK